MRCGPCARIRCEIEDLLELRKQQWVQMSDDEKLLRRVRGRVHSILDTLTVDNADKLSEDLAALLINSASLLKGLVTIIVDKALAE